MATLNLTMLPNDGDILAGWLTWLLLLPVPVLEPTREMRAVQAR